MRTAVRLANGDSYFRYSCFAVRKHQFCSVIDNTCIFLTGTAKEARYVYQSQDLNIEGIAETNETSCFTACVAVEHTCQPTRLVSDDTGRTTIETCETADDVLGIVFMNLHEVTVIDDGVDDLVHVVRFIRVSRNDVVQIVIHAGDVIGTLYERSLLHVVLRDEGNETTNFSQRLFLCSRHKMGHTGFGSVDLSAAELLYGYVLTGNGFHYLRAGDEHIGVLLGHHDEVGQRRAIYCSTGTRTKDHTNLRNNTRGQNVTLEDLGIAGQRTCSLLNTCSTRVVQTDDRRSEFHGLIHHIANLECHRLAQRTSDNCSILCKDEYQTTVNRTRSYCYTVTQEHFLLHAEVVTAVGKEHIHLFKRTFVEQHVNTLAASITAFCMVFFYCCFTASGNSRFAVSNQFIQFSLIHNMLISAVDTIQLTHPSCSSDEGKRSSGSLHLYAEPCQSAGYLLPRTLRELLLRSLR